MPLDYRKPSGETISIALIRKEARDKDRRIGSLLFNFGGPGGSGVDILPRAAGSYGKLNSRYDLVGFDPRGVAASSGVRCRTDEEQERAFRTVDLTPDTAAEEAAFIEDGAAFGAGCERRSGTVLPHVGTSNAARDLDLVRHVLGDDKLSYLGFSYGTELGGTYAHLFPHRVGRVVLDAVIDPTADGIGHARNQATGFQRALENYLKDRGQDPKAGSERIARMLARLDGKPLPTSSGRELTESLAITGIVTPLYSQYNWPELTAALDEAEKKGRGDGLLRLADSYNGRDESGRYDTQAHSQRAISCADSKARPRWTRPARCCPNSAGSPRCSGRSWPGTRRAGAPSGRSTGSTRTRRPVRRAPPRSWSSARQATRPRRTRGAADGGRAGQGRRHHGHQQGRGARGVRGEPVRDLDRGRVLPGREGSGRRPDLRVTRTRKGPVHTRWTGPFT